MTQYQNTLQKMKKVEGFYINHNKLKPDICISKIDDIITYDLRFIKPDTPPFLDQKSLHSIENLIATYTRNNSIKDKVIYFAPMGCKAGFYILFKNMSIENALIFIKNVIKECSEHETPGSPGVFHFFDQYKNTLPF